jgi:hypothetical protein
MLEISDDVVAFIQKDVDQQRKKATVQVPANVGG